MSCPDWRSLATHRLDATSPEPEGWGEAVAHLRSGCSHCRQEALQADPTLIFHSLATPAAAIPALVHDEAGSMRQAVEAMRRARRVETPAPAPTLKRWAVAAGMVLSVISLGVVGALHQGSVSAAKSPRAEVARVAASDGWAQEGSNSERSLDPRLRQRLDQAVADMPLVEGFTQEDARLYQMHNQDRQAFVGMMVVHESFESLDVESLGI